MQIILKPIDHISPFFLALFSFSLFFIQIIQGTSLAFAQNILIFNLVLGMAFNFVRGFSSVFGWLLVILALRQVVISQLVKVFFWQAADSGLETPLMTSQVYALGMLSMGAACFVSQFLNFDRLTLVKNHLSHVSPRFTTVLFVFGLIVIEVIHKRGEAPIILIPFLNALTYLTSIVYLALAYEFTEAVKSSHGQNLVNKKAILMFAALFISGMLSGSKQGMFSPFFVLFLVAIFNYYHLRFKGLILITVIIGFMSIVLTPLSDDGRNYFKKTTLTESTSAFLDYIQDNFSSWENYSNYLNRIKSVSIDSKQGKFYFGKPMMFLDRLSLIQDADKLVAHYAQIPAEGLGFLRSALYILPRSLTGQWIGSDEWQGDFFAKKVGVISEEDNATGVAFGIFAEAFAIQKWWGVGLFTFVTTLLLILGLSLLDVNGENRTWTVFVICYFQQIVGEAGLLGSLHVIVRMIPFLLICKKILENLEIYFAKSGRGFEAYYGG